MVPKESSTSTSKASFKTPTRRLVNRIRLPKFHFSKKTSAFIFLGLLLIFFGLITFLFKDVPDPTKLTRTPAPVSTQILDRNGNLLYEIYTEKNRTPISIKDLPPYVYQATVAVEDKNFYHHWGLDFEGILRAVFKIVTGQRLEGGSTITQQLVKTALLEDPSRTLTRKIREAALAVLTEVIYTKDQILELYLNHAPYGGTAYGIQAASRQFFDKDAKDLTIAQAALLAGLPQSPTKYSPFGAHPELASSRQKQVLRRMEEDGYITKQQKEEAENTTLSFNQKESTIKAPHFVLWIRDLLVERYGEELVNLGGLKVTTSLDLDIQQTAQASLSAEIKKLAKLRVGNGSALVTRPKTGEVLAMVGSRDYFDTEHDGNVNVSLRYRQPGSSIKPLNYAVGLLKGWTPATMYLDIPTCFSVTGQQPYCPKNYDGSFHGPTQMRFSLGNSYNIPAVKQLALNGIDAFIATASAMGITGWNNPANYGLSLTLGGGEVRMVDMAVAFGVFANSGVKVPLHPILKVETYQQKVLEELNLDEIKTLTETSPLDWNSFWNKTETPKTQETVVKAPQEAGTPIKALPLTLFERLFPSKIVSTTVQSSPIPSPNDEIKTVLPEEVSYIISHMLLDNNARIGAFGPSSQLVIKGKTVSVKTGTTNDLRDNWTIGYTPDYLATVWVGNNDNTAMSYVASGITGASPIWHDIMTYVLKNETDHFPTKPEGVVDAQICTDTGLLPSESTPCQTRNEIFIKDHLPPTTYPTRKQIWLRRDTHLPLMPGEQVIDLDLEEHYVLSDPFTKDFCLDCAYPQDTKPDPNNPAAQIPTGKINYPTFNINYDLFKVSPPSPTTWMKSTPTQQ